MTGDTIAAFVGPALGVKGGRSLNDVLAAHPGIRLERRIAAKAAPRDTIYAVRLGHEVARSADSACPSVVFKSAVAVPIAADLITPDTPAGDLDSLARPSLGACPTRTDDVLRRARAGARRVAFWTRTLEHSNTGPSESPGSGWKGCSIGGFHSRWVERLKGRKPARQ
jgi:hypothetical protein